MHIKVDVAYTIQQETTENVGEEFCCIHDDIPFPLWLRTCGHGIHGQNLL